MPTEVLEWVSDEDGGHFEHHMVDWDIPLNEDRDYPACVLCPITAYPKCLSECDAWKRTESR